MNDLKSIFEERLKQKGIEKQVSSALVCDAFNKALVEVFGEDVLSEAFAISFREGELKVGVKSSVLAQEIQGNWGELTSAGPINRLQFELRRGLSF